MPRHLAAIAAASVALACATSSAPPARVRGPVVPHPELSGEQLFVKCCGECHPPKNPADFRSAAWGRIVVRYVDRSALAPEDQPRVLAYLQAHAKDADPGTAAR